MTVQRRSCWERINLVGNWETGLFTVRQHLQMFFFHDYRHREVQISLEACHQLQQNYKVLSDDGTVEYNLLVLSALVIENNEFLEPQNLLEIVFTS